MDLKLVTTPRTASRSSTCRARSICIRRRGCGNCSSTWSARAATSSSSTWDKVGFLDSTGLGVLVGGLKRVRAHDGSLDLVCTQQRILKILKITGLTEVFGIYETVDQAIAAAKGRR